MKPFSELYNEKVKFVQQQEYFAHIVFLYSQSKDVDKQSRGKKVEPVEHWSSPYLDEVPEQVEVDTVKIKMAVFKIMSSQIISWLDEKISHVMSE